MEMLDGFDHYNTAATLRLKWDPASNPNGIVTGRYGGGAAQVASASNGITTNPLGAVATRTVGFAVYFAGSIPGATYVVAAFLDGSSTQVDFRINSGGTFSVTRNGTVLGTSSSSVTGSTWYYVEFQATIHGSAGAYRLDVTVAGTTSTWLSATGVNTQATGNASSDRVQIMGTAGIWMYVDDLYILNSSGAVNNTLLGERRVLTTLANADGAVAQWTPDSGTAHYSRVNEANPDGDTSYVSSSTAGQTDTYQFPDITAAVVNAVQVTVTARKDDTGARTVCAVYRAGGTNYDGAAFSPAVTYTGHRTVFETNPATSAAWTAAAVNSGEFGQKIVS